MKLGWSLGGALVFGGIACTAGDIGGVGTSADGPGVAGSSESGAGGAPAAEGTGEAGSDDGIGGAAGGALAPCTPETVLDDMEDGDGAICLNQGRVGGWYTVKGSSSSTIDPVADSVVSATALGTFARAGSVYGMRFVGSEFGNTSDDWAVLGVSVSDDGVYDASVHTRLRFWARANTELTLRVNFTTTASRPTDDGGSCVAETETSCNDHYGEFVDVGTSWTEYYVHFGYLEQSGWGDVVALDLEHLHTIHFRYVGAGGDLTEEFGNPSSFELYIDDVAFDP
jgi:hypothetical protein